jgi:hypothetical protein
MSETPDDEDGELRLDRSQFSVVSLTDTDDSLEYWLSRPVEERLRALERLRRTFWGAAATARIQRVLEVVKLEHF